jgi:leucyl aminopeptidase (aminopeptidase T)
VEKLEWVEGAKNYVKYAGIQKGEEVLVLAPTDADPRIVETVAMAAKDMGATVFVSYMSLPDLPFSQPPRGLAEAIKAVDAVLDLGVSIVGHSRAFMTAMIEYRTKGVILATSSPEVLKCPAARFPLELQFEIGRRVFEQVGRGKEIRVTDPRGGEVKAKIHLDSLCGNAGGMKPGPAQPGDFAIFPGLCVGYWPAFTSSGDIHFDSFTGLGKLSQPLHFVIEDGYIKTIEGGPEAEIVKGWVDGAENASHHAEIMWGVNPKARVLFDAKPMAYEAERSCQVLHMGFGASKLLGGRVQSTIHLDGAFLYPTVYIDGEPILVNGHLTVLDDPEIIKLASKFGDPADVLAKTPIT